MLVPLAAEDRTPEREAEQATEQSSSVLDLAQASQVGDSDPISSIHQATDFLNTASANRTIVELGSSPPAMGQSTIIKAGAWWDVVAETAYQFNYRLRSTSDSDNKFLRIKSATKGYRLQGVAITDTIAFTRPAKQATTYMGVQHIGPWRLEAAPKELAVQRSLNGIDRWLSLRFITLGEPHLAAHGSYHVDALITQAENQAGEKRSISNSEPRLFNTRPGHSHLRYSSHFNNRHMQQSELYIAGITAADESIHLKGSLSVAQLADWQQTVVITPNKWFSYPMGSARLRLALITDAEFFTVLREDIGLDKEQQEYTAPHLLITIEGADDLAHASREHILEKLVISQPQGAFVGNPSQRFRPRIWSEARTDGTILLLRRDVIGPALLGPGQQAEDESKLLLQTQAPLATFSADIELAIDLQHGAAP